MIYRIILGVLIVSLGGCLPNRSSHLASFKNTSPISGVWIADSVCIDGEKQTDYAFHRRKKRSKDVHFDSYWRYYDFGRNRGSIIGEFPVVIIREKGNLCHLFKRCGIGPKSTYCDNPYYRYFNDSSYYLCIDSTTLPMFKISMNGKNRMAFHDLTGDGFITYYSRTTNKWMKSLKSYLGE